MAPRVIVQTHINIRVPDSISVVRDWYTAIAGSAMSIMSVIVLRNFTA